MSILSLKIYISLKKTHSPLLSPQIFKHNFFLFINSTPHSIHQERRWTQSGKSFSQFSFLLLLFLEKNSRFLPYGVSAMMLLEVLACFSCVVIGLQWFLDLCDLFLMGLDYISINLHGGFTLYYLVERIWKSCWSWLHFTCLIKCHKDRKSLFFENLYMNSSEKFVSFHEIKYYFKVKDHSWQCWTFWWQRMLITLAHDFDETRYSMKFERNLKIFDYVT